MLLPKGNKFQISYGCFGIQLDSVAQDTVNYTPNIRMSIQTCANIYELCAVQCIAKKKRNSVMHKCTAFQFNTLHLVYNTIFCISRMHSVHPMKQSLGEK